MNESTLVPREEMSDLDWLARNVHVFESCANYVTLSSDAHFHQYRPAGVVSYTKDQWLARRAELRNKPAKWPIGANWIAQDKDGEWWFYTDEIDNPPQNHGEDNWYSDDVAVRCRLIGEVLGDWRDTLEKRPDASEIPSHSNQPNPSAEIPECAKVKQFEPFVSVEDAATAKQPAPKGSGNPILGMVLADLTNRALEGKKKYGEPLLAHNGRNPLWDAYQEVLDLAMYLRQAIEEQK